MTSMPPNDPLVSLWQTAPRPDTQHLVQDLQRLNRLHQRHNRSVLTIVCGIAVLLVFEEATGRLASHGILSGIWIAGVVAGLIWQRRARCNQLDALTLDTVRLLKAMIARAKRDLFEARCLYAGVPLGAAVGFAVSSFVGIRASESGIAAHPHLEIAQTGAGVAALIAMIAAGAILARSRRIQVRELSEKLKAIETEL
ncbi:hypothetical protein [Terracidiphilus gabretensis]|uniref:hypothetical protein n=1 Tax=Terracidiphilus gabretensis TaxID=1577687 RepID=UPI00071B83F0|nr:hypothetical protein [Terracidiphilus gabretensis]